MALIEFNVSAPVRAAVVFPDFADFGVLLSPAARLEEAVGLARAISLDVVYKEIVRLRVAKPSTLVGQGVLERLTTVIETKKVSLIIFDASLTPIQQRNLEKKLQIKVIDRTALILEIFGERAQTKEGK